MAMLKTQKDLKEALTKNRVMIVKNLQIDEEFMSYMMESGKTITEAMKEEIEVKDTRQAKVGKLLEILPRRGPGTFETFMKALVYTHQEHISEVLDKELSNQLVSMRNAEIDGTLNDDSSDYPGPRETPSKSYNDKMAEIKSGTVPLLEVINPVSSTDVTRLITEMDCERVYRVNGRVRGRAVIMNIQNFVRLPVREGSEEDVYHLEKLFSRLQFDVVKYDDELLANAEAIKACLESERRLADHESADMFVLCFMSHGTEGCVYALDGSTVPVKTIVDFFDGKRCPKLQNKPKLFFIQACQGKTTTVGVSADTTDGPVASGGSPSLPPSSSNVMDVPDALQLKPYLSTFNATNLVHEKRDILIGMSSVSGYVANRNMVFGSLYIRCLVYVFSRQAHKDHVVDMLTDVSNIMSKFTADVTREVYAPDQQNSLNKRVYFMPGFPDSSSS